MASFNKVVLLGNLTRDPELKYTPSGKAVTDVGLAVNERYKKDDEWIERTVFVDVTFFGRTAEVLAEFQHKGSPILLEGRLRYESWEKDDQKRSRLKVICDTFQMLGSRKSDSEKPESTGDAQQPVGAAVSDDTPF